MKVKVKFLQDQLVKTVLYKEGKEAGLNEVLANNLSKAKIVKIIKEK